MAFEKLDLEIVTPERLVLAETVDSVVLPGSEGSFGVLPGHAPFLTALAAGEMSYRVGGQEKFLAVSGGFVEVLRDRVSVLAGTCERPDEIDADRARQARERAEAVLKDPGAGQAEVLRAQERIRRADARLQVLRRGA